MIEIFIHWGQIDHKYSLAGCCVWITEIVKWIVLVMIEIEIAILELKGTGNRYLTLVLLFTAAVPIDWGTVKGSNTSIYGTL